MQNGVNIYDIARLCGVSKSTVSRVLNGHDGVNEETRKRVLQAIDEHDYIPNNSARSLSSISTQTVVLLVYGITNPFFSRIIALILEKMSRKDFDVILHSFEPGFDSNIFGVVQSVYKEKRPKGIILLGGNFEKNHNALRQIGVPIVMASTTISNTNDRSWFSSVTINDEEEGFKMADYVCRNGHRNIAIIGQFRLREKGIRAALRQHGVTPTANAVDYDRAYAFRTGYREAKKLLDAKPPATKSQGIKPSNTKLQEGVSLSEKGQPPDGAYTCFLCLSDVLAIGAMRAVHEHGLRIPEDISIVGFDGIENGEYTNPILTTFVQPFDEIAEKSVATLLGLINEGKPHKHMILQTTLEEGESFRPIRRDVQC